MHDFIQYIFYLLQRGLDLAVPAVGLCAVALLAVWAVARKNNRAFPWKKAVCLLLAVGWLAVTVYATLLRSEPGYREWNFHLLLAWKEAWNQFTLQVWLNILLNIALFVPLGLLLPLLARPFRKWSRLLAAGFGSSLAIELCQLAAARGMFDVDDLLTNTLGAILGWSIVMLLVTLAERAPGWKRKSLACLSVPAALALVFAGIFGSYALQPYGNLPDASAVRADLDEVEWELAFTPEDSSAEAQVYQAGRLDKVAAERFGDEFAANVGITFPDRYYYDDLIIFADHSTGDFLDLSQRDGSWEYDVGREVMPVFDEAPLEIRPEALLEILRGWSIPVPEGAEFTVEAPEDSSSATAGFTAELIPQGETLFYGTLRCRLRTEDGKTELDRIENQMVALSPCGEEAILSPAQAVEALQSGRSFWGTVLERQGAEQVRITDCALDWLADTKGFYQPVYRFELRVGEEGTMTDYVPALC